MSDIDLALLRTAVDSAVKASRDERRVIVRPGTVSSLGANQEIAEVMMDDDPSGDGIGGDDVADTGTIGAHLMISRVRTGDRVQVMFVPPHGAYVIGRLGGEFEDWRYVGVEDQPAFATNWGNSADTGIPDTDNFSQVKFRCTGMWTELRGRASRSADATGPSTIFTLPDDCLPGNKMSFPVTNGPLGAPQALILITLAGAVQVVKFGGSIGSPDGGFVSLDGIGYTTTSTDDTSFM